MEFIVEMSGPAADLVVIEDTLRAFDPAALVDVAGHTLRIAGAFNADVLASLLAQAGHPVSMRQIVLLPSVCCGGCSG